MGFVNIISKIPTMMMNLNSSIFSSGSTTKFIAAATGFEGIGLWISDFLCHIFYFGCKWILYLIDILYSFIKQLSGLDMSFDSLESMVSKESDFVFNLLFSATDLIVPIIRSLIGITIVLIVFFAILAIVKTQFNSLRSKTPADIKGVFRDTLKAFILLFITPMIAIGGIVASNLILQTLYNATNTSDSTSLSSQLFSATTKTANAYRVYAQDGMRIPITLDVTKQKEIIEYYKKHPLSKDFLNYVESNENLIYMNYKMFQNGTFVKYDYLNDATSAGTGNIEQNVKDYYMMYDRSKAAYEDIRDNKTTINSYMKISSYKSEYYVMADVVEFCIDSGTTAYIKTIEQVIQSIVDTKDVGLFNSFRNLFGIEFLDDNLKYCRPGNLASAGPDEVLCEGQNTYLDIFKGNKWKVIRYSSWYYDANEHLEPHKKMQIEYNHVRGATDEINGAKFIISVLEETQVEKEVTEFVDDVAVTKIKKDTVNYYQPLTIGLASGNQYGFKSDFIQTGQIIAAKGIFSMYEDPISVFDNGKAYYPVPTAIRISNDGSEVQFYRHDLKTVTVGDSGGVVTGSIKEKTDIPILGGILDFFKKLWALVNPNYDFIIDKDQEAVAYTCEETLVNRLSSGKLSISYMFEDDFSTGIGWVLTKTINGTSSIISDFSEDSFQIEQLSIYGLKLGNLFVAYKINILVLVIGALSLIKIIFSAVFVLINRGYELFLVILVYPTACATIPIMEKQDGFKVWMQTYTKRLFATYGLILGLNFILMLFPIISEIEFFTAADIALSTPLMRLRKFFGFALPLDFVAGLLNLNLVIMFQLAAFSLLNTVPDMIKSIAGGDARSIQNPLESFGKVVNLITGIVKTFSGVVDGIKNIIGFIADDKKRAEIIENVKRKAKEFVPGSEIVESVKDFKNLQNKKKAQREAMETLKDSLEGGIENDPNKSEEENKKAHADQVSKNFQAMLDAQSSYNSALSNPRSNRYAEEDKKRNNRIEGLDEDGNASSRYEEDGDAEEDADLTWKSEKELRAERKKAEQVIRVLEKKEKKGGVLTAEEQKALETHRKILENVKNAQKRMGKNGTDKKEYDANKKRLDELKKLQSLGIISTAQLIELKQVQQKVDDYEHRGEKNKARRKEVEEKRKEREEDKKEEEKRKERLKKYRRAFGRMDKGSVKIQQQYWTEYAENVKDIQDKLDLAGYTGKKLEEMTDEELKKALEDKTIPEEQQKLLKKYALMRNEKKEMIGLTEQHFAAQEQREITAQTHKNRRKMGTLGGKKMDRKMQGTAQAEEQELTEIETKIAAMQGNVNGSNLAEYQKLLRRRQELQSKKKFRDQWHEQHANLTPKQLKEMREEQKRIDKWEEEAVRTLGVTAKRDAIERYIAKKKKEYDKKHKKK